MLFTNDKEAQFTFDDYLVPVAYPIGQEVAGGWRTEYLEWDKNECLVVLTDGNEMYKSLNKFTVNTKPLNILNLRRQKG